MAQWKDNMKKVLDTNSDSSNSKDQTVGDVRCLRAIAPLSGQYWPG